VKFVLATDCSQTVKNKFLLNENLMAMEFKFECPSCGQHLSAVPSQIGGRAPCPSCGATVTVPSQPNVPTPVPRFSPQAQQSGMNPLCRTCGQGALIKRKKFRMSGPVVAVGFILLVPSVLGVLFGVLMLFVTGATSSNLLRQTSGRFARTLQSRGFPPLSSIKWYRASLCQMIS
jgi:hypothetical protein